MTAIDDIDDMLPGTHFERVEALSRATTRLRFDPYADIDWDATETFRKRMIRVGCLIRIPFPGGHGLVRRAAVAAADRHHLRSYKAMGKRAGLELGAQRNIRKNTLPTYPLDEVAREGGLGPIQGLYVSASLNSLRAPLVSAAALNRR
jgi:hypothetical protein